jgi:hypothetical protein
MIWASVSLSLRNDSWVHPLLDIPEAAFDGERTWQAQTGRLRIPALVAAQNGSGYGRACLTWSGASSPTSPSNLNSTSMPYQPDGLSLP